MRIKWQIYVDGKNYNGYCFAEYGTMLSTGIYCTCWYAYSIHCTEIRIISQTSLKITNLKYIYHVPLIKLALRFYSWDFDILNYKIFINEFQIV